MISSLDNYLNLIFGLNQDPTSVLLCFFLTIGRLAPILFLAPFFGGKNIPKIVRMMFAVSLTCIVLPQEILSLKKPLMFDGLFTILLIKELLIGFILGFLAALPFYIAQSSGSLIDHIRGASSLQVTDPTTQTQTGPIGIFYNYVLIATFFIVNGPILFLDAISASFFLIPVDHFINPIFFSAKIAFWQRTFSIMTYVFNLSIQIGAPSIIGVLMAEMFLGIANRMAPQVQIVFLGISLKSWVGLGMLAAAWYFIMQQLSRECYNWLRIIEETLQSVSR